MKKKALFSGTFDPFTNGHDAIVKRALAITDELIIAIANNTEKKSFFPLEERLANIKKIYDTIDNIHVTSYDMLTIDFAKQAGVDFLIRGVRSLHDFEYEKNMADVNRMLSGIETVFLFSEPALASISSSLIRELIIFKQDITKLIPIIK